MIPLDNQSEPKVKKVCVLLDAPQDLKFMALAYNNMVQKNDVTIPFVIIKAPDSYEMKFSPFKQLLGKLVIQARVIMHTEAELIERVPLEKIAAFANSKIIYSEVLPSGKFGTIFPPQIIELIKSEGIDLIIRRGFGILKGDILTCAPFGVLSLHPGRLKDYRGAMATVKAYINDEKYIYTSVQRLNEHLDRGELFLEIPVDVSQVKSYREAYNLLCQAEIDCLDIVIKKINSPDFQILKYDKFDKNGYYPIPEFGGFVILFLQYVKTEIKRRVRYYYRKIFKRKKQAIISQNKTNSAATTPLISVVIATFNSARTLERCLSSLRAQNYPQDRIELITADGGSTDGTRAITKKYNGKIIDVPRDKQGAEFNKGYGLQYATGEFILGIDHDNILPHENWLNKMLQPLLDNPEIVAVEPLRYQYNKKLSLLDRYFALFGVNDPLPYYIGKADRMDYIHDNYNLLGKAEDKGDYYIVEFDQNQPRKIPTLGANGFLIRHDFFKKSDHEPDHYFHIDINVDIVKQGFTKYAFIKDDIIHLTNSQLFNFLKRRKKFMDQYYLNNFSARRYSVYHPEDDKKNLIKYILFTITFVRPLCDSIRGWLKIHDPAWFIHPFMCLAMLYIYSLTSIKGFLKK